MVIGKTLQTRFLLEIRDWAGLIGWPFLFESLHPVDDYPHLFRVWVGLIIEGRALVTDRSGWPRLPDRLAGGDVDDSVLLQAQIATPARS
jgi:hypothetical protein